MKQESYECGENTGAHGNKYEQDLAFVLFVRSSLAGRSFKLATELIAAGKFDDDVLFVEHLQEAWLFQAKHSTKQDKVPCKELFPKDVQQKNNDFDLFKYIRSYFFVERNMEKYGLQNKYFIFSNKSFEENDELKQWVDIVPREVHSLMDFSKKRGRHVGFKPKEEKIDIIRNHVNSEFLTLKEVIIALFEGGIIQKQTLSDYKAYLSNILEVTGNCLKFRDAFLDNSDDAAKACLCKQLQTHFQEKKQDMRTIPENLDKSIKDQLRGKPRNVQLPPFVDDTIVKQFFNRLILCIDQPNDLMDIIDDDLRLWMKSWIRPDDLGKFGESQSMLPRFKFGDEFTKWNKPNMAKVDKKCKDKPFLSNRDGEKCVQSIEKELKTYTSKDLEALERYHVERTLYKAYDWSSSDEIFLEKLDKCFDENKCSIIIAEPGMGKTTLLQYIGFEVQKRFNRDVFLIYFKNLNEKLKSVESNEIESKISQIFKKVLSESSLKILQSKENKNLLLFDGFDEIAVAQSDKAIALVQMFQKSSNTQIIVTGRSHVQEKLEQKFKVKPINLDRFKYSEKRKFLRYFWDVPKMPIVQVTDDVKTTCDRKNKKFELFSSTLLKSFNFDLTGVPLQIRMLAEVHWNTFNQYLESDSDDLREIFSTDFSVIQLYETFVEKSFYLKCRKKQGQEAYLKIETYQEDDEMDLQFQQYVLEHQLIAIKQLEIKELKTVIEDGNHTQHIDRLLKRIKNGSEKSLLISFTNDKSPVEFVHRSYAEYFVAKYMFDNVSKYSGILFQILEQHKLVRKFFFLQVEEYFATRSSTHLAILDNICASHSDVAFWACEASCIKVVEKILENRKFQTELHKTYGSLLHVVADVGCIELIAYLLNDASSNGNAEMVKSVNIEAQDKNGRTPVLVAASRQHWETVQLLIDKSANINAQDKDGKSVLYWAAVVGELGIVKMLIDQSANLEVRDKDGKTILLVAAHWNHWEIVKFLIATESANIEARNNKGESLLHLAAFLGQPEIVRMLIDKSADIEARDKDGNTPILMAAGWNQWEIVTTMIEKSPSVESQNNDGETLLYLAAYFGEKDIVNMLIGRSANIEAQDKKGNTPLHVAAHNGNIEVFKALIEAKHQTRMTSDDLSVAQSKYRENYQR